MKDHRKELRSGEILRFPGMTCTVEGEAGRGSNAIVYKASYPDLINTGEHHTVLIKELFPFHRKGAIFRDRQNCIVCEESGRDIMDLHRQSFIYGNRIHLRMLDLHPDMIGGYLNTFSLNETQYTILGYSGGRSLEQECHGKMPDLHLIVRWMLGLLDALEVFHESGYLHLDIAPDNILLIGRNHRERIMLIDYNSVTEISLQADPAYYSVKTGFSAPEIRTGRHPEVSSDLYSVAAVFFWCITGNALTAFQASRPAPPNVSDCACMREMPDTVQLMVRQILWKGLQTLPRKRFSSVSQMRESMQELLDRINGVGITHWALWEGGRRIVSRMIRENLALSFIQDSEELFPSYVQAEDGTVQPVQEYVSSFLSDRRGSVLLTAPGGMGKTTALLRTVLEQSGVYSPLKPAIIYLSLYGWKSGENDYIANRILENLRFKPEQHTFVDARHALELLMERPLRTMDGTRPMLLLLLDGLNEAVGETRPLLEEIQRFSKRQGVSVLVSGRSAEPALLFPTSQLIPLREPDVEKILLNNGLLVPESPTMRELLKTPLMLSIFLQTSLEEQLQLSVETQGELIGAYLVALQTKALRCLTADTEERWQVEAALSYVLPSIAGALQKKSGAMEDSALLPVTAGCYRLFSRRIMRRAFPQWIGHSKAIRGDAANEEEWYGKIVHDLLWRQLGLLVLNEHGQYLISHQIIGAYLADIDRQNRLRIKKLYGMEFFMLCAILVLLLSCGRIAYTRFINPPPKPYDQIYAGDVLAWGLDAYNAAGRQYNAIRQLVDCAMEDPEHYWDALERYDFSTNWTSHISGNAAEDLKYMLSTGDVMPQSGKPMDADSYLELLTFSDSCKKEYTEFVLVLTYVMEDDYGKRMYDSTYLPQLSKVIDTDASIIAGLFQLACREHMRGDGWINDTEWKVFQDMASKSPLRLKNDLMDANPKVLREQILQWKSDRSKLVQDINFCAAIEDYHRYVGQQ